MLSCRTHTAVLSFGCSNLSAVALLSFSVPLAVSPLEAVMEEMEGGSFP